MLTGRVVLFVEVFLVVSITSGALETLVDVAKDIESLPSLLAKNLPDASNYFFSYLLLQGASVSSGTLLQISALVSAHRRTRATLRENHANQCKGHVVHLVAHSG